MKGLLLAASALLLMFASLTAPAQEMSVRNGVVTGISPIQVEGSPSSKDSGGSATGGAFKRIFGRAVGRAVAKATGDYSTGYEAREIVNGAAEDITANAGDDGGETVTAYMVLIKFDGGGESAIQSARVDNLRVGGRVKVFGTGGSARIVAQ